MKLGIVGNSDHAEAGATLRRLLVELMNFPHQGCAISSELAALLSSEELSKCTSLSTKFEVAENSDVVFSIGGDGTMLSSARAILTANPGASLVGLNLGKLGFISENPPEEIGALLRELSAGKLIKESRLVLSAIVESQADGGISRYKRSDTKQDSEVTSASLIATNEIVIDNFGSTRMLTFEIRVNGALLGTFRADGVIVATPTGSTGYAVSAGGPIVEPTSKVLLLTPIAPHSLNIRPILVPQESEIVVTASSDETRQALVVADGQEEVVADSPVNVTVKAGPHPLRLMRRTERNYFDLLRSKLLWSLDARDGRR